MKTSPRNKLLLTLGMMVLAVALVGVSGWWYTTARAPYLTTHPTAVAVEGVTPLAVSEEMMSAYGVLSATGTGNREGTHTGYVVVAETVGYKSPIRVQCTFSADGQTLAQLRVVSQGETEYLGDRITGTDFTASFGGRRLPMKLWTSAQAGSPVDGLAGSTISAQAVVDGANNAYRFLQAYLAG